MIPQTDRICIIGGGPAGIGAGWYLEKAGYRNVTILEKADHVGGKAHSIVVDGNTVDLGALDVASDYYNVRKIAEELNIPTRETAPLGVFDFAGGKAESSLGALTKANGKIATVVDVLKYFRAIGWTYDTFLEAPGMTNVPAPLAVTMLDWMKANGIAGLAPMFDYVCTGFGYGPLDKIPAAYLLRFVDWGDFVEMLEVSMGVRQWPRNFVKGYGNVMIMMSRRLSDVRLNVEVESVTRHPGTADPIQVRVRGAAEPLKFDRLIMACRTDSTLGDIVKDLQPEAKAVFSKVKYQPYSTAVCRVDGVPWISLGAIPIPEDGHTYCMIQPWQGGDAAAFYIMNPQHLPADTILKNIRDDLGRIKTLDGAPVTFRVDDMVDYVEWNYFPHFEPADLAEGAYDRIDTLQGQSNTYFVGGLLGFETIHNTLAYSESIVQRFFSPK